MADREGHAWTRVTDPAFAVWGFALALAAAAWNRILPPVFGYPPLGDLGVQCAMLIGLGSGALYGYRKGGRIGRPSRILALLGMGAAVAALAAYLLLSGLEGPYFAISGGFRGQLASSLLGMLLVGSILFVPNFLVGSAIALGMGLGSCRRPDPTDPSADGGRSWGTESAFLLVGIAAGSLAAGFLLVPALGAFGSLLCAAGALAAMGAVFLLGGRRLPEAGKAAPAPPDARPPSSAVSALLIAIFAFSVAACAIFWVGVLGQFTGRTAYAGAAARSVFFASAGVGAILAARFGRRRLGDGRVAGLTMGIAGLAWLGLAFLEAHLGAGFLRLLGTGPARWAGVVRSYFGLAIITLAVPGALSGCAAVLGVKGLASRAGGWARDAFLPILAAGWFAACLVSMFVPGPALGLEGTALAAPLVAVASGAAFLVLNQRGRTFRIALPAALACAAAVLAAGAPSWNPAAISSGIFVRPERMTGIADLAALLRSADVPFCEAEHGNVISVSRTVDGLYLKIDGAPAGSTVGDVPSEIMAAHVPLVMAEDPDNVLLLGFGTGITLGSVESHRVAQVDCVEPSKSVIRAARYFSPYNLNALQDRRVNLTYCDPANYLLLSRARYDVIISSRAIAGKDFVRLARARLAPDGILCQAADLDLVGEDGLRSVAKEFSSFFPHVGLWWTGSSQVLVTGSLQPFKVEVDTLLQRLASGSVKRDLARLGTMDDAGFLSFYLMGRDELVDWGGDVPADDRARSFLTYWAPRRLPGGDNAETFIGLDLHDVNPATLIAGLDEGTVEQTILYDRLTRCMDARGDFFSSLAAAGGGQLRDAARYLERAAGNCPENGLFRVELSDFCITYSRALAQDDRFAEAVSAARRAVETNPDNYRAYYNLATLESRRDLKAARDLLRMAVQINPDYFAAQLMKAEVEIAAGMVDEASETVERVLSVEPLNLRAHYLRALCFIQRNLLEDAKSDLALVTGSEPDDASALSALGYIYLLQGDLGKAQAHYEKVLRSDPRNLEALNNLATVLAEKRDYRKAVTIWERALEMDPGNQDIKDNLSEARQKMSKP